MMTIIYILLTPVNISRNSIYIILSLASTQLLCDNYLNNSRDQSAETPKCQMMVPVKEQKAAASEGLGWPRIDHLTQQGNRKQKQKDIFILLWRLVQVHIESIITTEWTQEVFSWDDQLLVRTYII